MLGGELHPAPLFYVLSERAHRLLGDFRAFAAINRGFRDIDSSEDFGAATFALDPKCDCSLHSIFGALKAAACDGLSDKILLLGGDIYLHALKLADPA
jgi:hypothetical protein